MPSFSPSLQKPKALVNLSNKTWEKIMRPASLRALEAQVEILSGGPLHQREAILGAAQSTEILITGWGSQTFTRSDLDAFPSLKLIVHTAGSLRYAFPEQSFPPHVAICTASGENARPVAEFTLGLILSGLRGAFSAPHHLRTHGLSTWSDLHEEIDGYPGHTIAIVGFGEIAKRLITLLQPFDFRLLVVSHVVTASDEACYGIRRSSLEEAAREADVLTLHEADIPIYRGMIGREVLQLMKDGAILINTARGRLIHEQALAEALKHRPLTALLDVLAEEEAGSPIEDHPFLHLPNCFLTPHIAGSRGAEIKRFGDYLVREVTQFCSDQPLENSIDLRSLHQRA